MLAPASPKGLKLLSNVDALLTGKVGLFDVAADAIDAVARRANSNDGWSTICLSVCRVHAKTKASNRNRHMPLGECSQKEIQAPRHLHSTVVPLIILDRADRPARLKAIAISSIKEEPTFDLPQAARDDGGSEFGVTLLAEIRGAPCESLFDP